MYRRLDVAAVLATTERLAARIEERFPERGLCRVGRDVVAVSHEIAGLEATLGHPIAWARALAIVATVLLLGGVVAAPVVLDVGWGVASAVDLVTSVESLVNDLVFAGIAVWFVWSIEGRLKRERALHALSQLRSLAHVIDMHQLPKDPEGSTRELGPTASSPTRDLDGALLARYLDYCSELLALLGKLAALVAQDLDDPVVLSTVQEIEELTTALSRKIWQKIMIIDRLTPGTAAAVSGDDE